MGAFQIFENARECHLGASGVLQRKPKIATRTLANLSDGILQKVVLYSRPPRDQSPNTLVHFWRLSKKAEMCISSAAVDLDQPLLEKNQRNAGDVSSSNSASR
jgi:hypothetical protein